MLTVSLNLSEISIHAPVKGATRIILSDGSTAGISIHAPVKGATVSVYAACLDLWISIHAPVKGATGLHVLPVIVEQFQSTLP